MGGVCSAYGGGERRGAYRVLVGKSESLGINDRIILKCIGRRPRGIIDLAQDRD
jgi:hypothetical protein